LIRELTRQRPEYSRISDLLIELAIVARQHIRANLATLSRFNLAPPGHLKFARHLHFNIASRPHRNPATKKLEAWSRQAAVRHESAVDSARNSNVDRR